MERGTAALKDLPNIAVVVLGSVSNRVNTRSTSKTAIKN